MPSQTAADIMTRSVVTLLLTSDIYDAVRTLLKHKISGAPVVDENQKLVGVLSEKDCLKVLVGAALEGLPEGRVSDYMTRDVETIGPSSSLYEVVHRFISRPYRRLPVVDDTGRVIWVGESSGCAHCHRVDARQLLPVRHERRAPARRDGRRFRHADRPGQEAVSILRLAGVLALASCIGGCATAIESPGSHTFQGPTMGTTFSVTVVGDLNDMQVASLRSSIEHTVAKIDATMSTFRADSEVTRV